MKRFTKLLTICLLSLVMITMVASLGWAAKKTERPTSEIEKDLRATKREHKEFKSLQSKLKSSGNQSSNASRQKVIPNINDFMRDCIKRRESDLGDLITIKQHGEMVKSGTSGAAHYDDSSSSKKSGKGEEVNSDRLHQLSGMKSIYVGAKNNSQPAIERQGNAFDRYTETIDKFAKQLEWGVNAMTRELDRRTAESEAKKTAEQELFEDK